MSQVLEKAVELTEALEVCDEMKTMKEKEAALQSDPQALAIHDSYIQMQNQLYQLQEMGKEPEAELLQQFKDAETKLESNMVIAEYYQACAELGKIVQKINGLISKAITGQDPTECAPSDCEGCPGGCH